MSIGLVILLSYQCTFFVFIFHILSSPCYHCLHLIWRLLFYFSHYHCSCVDLNCMSDGMMARRQKPRINNGRFLVTQLLHYNISSSSSLQRNSGNRKNNIVTVNKKDGDSDNRGGEIWKLKNGNKRYEGFINRFPNLQGCPHSHNEFQPMGELSYHLA